MKVTLVLLALAFSAVAHSKNVSNGILGENIAQRCSPGNILFYGQTVHGGKEVLICQMGTNLFYSYGKLGEENPELYLKRDSVEVKYLQGENNSEMFNILNGKYIYSIVHTPVKNNEVYYLNVSTNEGKKLASIEIDKTFVINNFKVNFSQ